MVFTRWCSGPGLLYPHYWELWPNSSIFVSSDQRVLLLMVWELFRWFLANSQWAVKCLSVKNDFHLATTIEVWSVEWLHWLLFCKFLHSPQKNSGSHSEWPMGCPSNRGPLFMIAQFGWAARSRNLKNVGGSKSLPFENDGGYRALGRFQCCGHFPVSFFRSLPVSPVYRPHGLVFTRHQLWDLTQTDVCLLLIMSQSI